MQNRDLNFLMDFFQRLSTDNPEFFKKLRSILGVLVTLGIVALILVGYTNLIDPILVEKYKVILYCINSVLTSGFFFTFLPTTKPELQDEKTIQNIVKTMSIEEFTQIKKIK